MSATTMAVSRAINYVRERRRRAPRLRSLGRRLQSAPGREQLRVHHFLPGMGITTLTGAAAIVTRGDRREFVFSLPFGVGTGLTLDELPLLIQLDNPYWGQERFPLLQAATGALGASLLGIRFWLQGRNQARRDD
jgi:hypothetical protein